MKFRYKARTKEGEVQTGFVEAGDRDSAAHILAGHDLFIIGIASAERTRWYNRLASYFGGVKQKDMVVFTRQLATLLEAHIPLNDSLKTLSRQMTHKVLREGVTLISEDIDAGLSFSQALARQSAIFSEFFVSMIRSAEVTGNIDEVVSFLADYYEKEYILVGKSRSALIYPAVVIGLFVVVVIVMLTFVFPQIAPLFEESEVELPFLSRVLIGTGNFLLKWWPLVILTVMGLIGMALSWLKTPEGKGFFDDFKIKAPLIKKVYIPLSVARFSNAAYILIRGGVPVAQAMEIVSHTVDNVHYQELLHEAGEAVRRGEPLSKAIEAHPEYFPPLLSQMLVIGETTGQLDKIFERVATFYNREADSIIANMVDLIQPVLMIVVGGMVGLLFASILLPILRITTQLT